jgi:acyl carrier protein
MNPANIIREFIIENFLFGNSERLSSGTNLFEEGIVDSTGIIELISFIETTFNISINDEELITDNFSSLDSISGFISNKSIIKLAQ